MQNSLEKTFIRGQSPTFSEELTSENGMSSTLPMDGENGQTSSSENFLRPGNYDYQQRTQTLDYDKGRHTFAFWSVVSLLTVLTVGNLILTLTIIGVLRLGKGLHGMELVPEEDTIKMFGSSDLDRVYLKGNGQIEGFVDSPMSITGDDGSVLVKISRNGQLHSRLVMEPSGTTFKNVNTFDLKDSNSGDVIFTTHRPHYNIPNGADNLKAKVISTAKVTSPIGKPLGVNSDSKLSIKGSEGINIDAQNVFLLSEDNIAFNSTQGAIFLNGADGIFLDVNKIPIVNSEFGIRTSNLQFKMCVCMPQGKLFRIPIPRLHTNGVKISCTHFNPKHDPCA